MEHAHKWGYVDKKNLFTESTWKSGMMTHTCNSSTWKKKEIRSWIQNMSQNKILNMGICSRGQVEK